MRKREQCESRQRSGGETSSTLSWSHSRRSASNDYVVLISKRFVILSVMSCTLVAFAIGRISRMILLNETSLHIQFGEVNQIENVNSSITSTLSSAIKKMATLPDPILKEGKTAPPTEYTSKTFDTSRSASTQSRWVVTEEGSKRKCQHIPGKQECAVPTAIMSSPSSEKIDVLITNSTEDDADLMKIHLPAGQHLLMDIENVDGPFLNSEERLAIAMLELVNKCGLTLLSYHCHKMIPMGVSCAGVLLESHVSFHTWPEKGVISIDLYTCGPNSLLPIVSLAEKLFAIPIERSSLIDEKENKKPNMVWAHKIRGFPDGMTSDSIADITDMQYSSVGRMTDYKKEIVSASTDFQHVDIYDILRSPFQTLEGYQKSLLDDGSYESQHPELFKPDRVVFLDGVTQSRRSGDSAYHESLVHPAMFAHSNPKRVAIIGGGEGATLREVLKHNTVEKVMMIEIDKIMVELSREYLPSWSDCSPLVGSTPSCFDDPRVEVHYMDAFQWFIDNFPVDKPALEQPFDIIIMDALDPQIQKEFVNALYDSGPFLHSLPNALADTGIFLAQVGEGNDINDPAEYLALNRNRVKFVKSLVKIGFLAVRDYIDGGHSGFDTPWQIIVAFKDYDTKADWFANPALVNLKIRTRSLPTMDGSSTFKYFDGPAMQTFWYPSKPTEVVFCRGNPDIKQCKEGHGFDAERINLPLKETLEVKESSLGPSVGRGVFAKVDIPENSYVGLDGLIPIIYGAPQTYELMSTDWHGNITFVYDHYYGEDLDFYSNGYGHIFSYHGRNEMYVDSTIQCFINHACNGTNNVGHKLTISEFTANPDQIADEILNKYTGHDVIYNPAAERQIHYYSSAIPLRSIKKGEELFDNYLAMCGRSKTFWYDWITDLKSECEGKSVGSVVEYDTWVDDTEAAAL